MKTQDYVNLLKLHYGVQSDYALAKKFDVHLQTVRKWSKGAGTFDESTAIRIAEVLKIDPGKVILDAYAARTNSPEVKHIIEDLSKRLTGLAAALLLAFVVTLGAIPAPAFAGAAGYSVYYVKSWRRWLSALKLGFLPTWPIVSLNAAVFQFSTLPARPLFAPLCSPFPTKK